MSCINNRNNRRRISCENMLDYISSIFWQRIETGLPISDVDAETKCLSCSKKGVVCMKCSGTERNFARLECSRSNTLTSPLQLVDIHEKEEVSGFIELPAKIVTVKLSKL